MADDDALQTAPDPLDGACLFAKIDALAKITDVPGEITRIYGGPAHKRAIDLVAAWMRAAWMRVELDAAGTVVGRYPGLDPAAPAILIGSHIDSVTNAGAYDGTLGVILGLAVVEALHRRGRMLRAPIEVLAFGDEEGVRFKSTLSGARALAGTFDPAILDETDGAGVSRRGALEFLGADPSGILALARRPGAVRCYLEAHIEQGPVLEANGLPLGIVTAINGATRGTIEITGTAGHAGTLPMAMRRDALAAAAEMVLAVETAASATDQLVATVGRIEVPGGAINVVPGRAQFTLDIRAPVDAARMNAFASLSEKFRAIAKKRGVLVKITRGYDAPAAPCDAALQDALAAAMSRAGLAPYRLPSGAGHDAMAFHNIFPLAMLFIRCKAGISHNPAEYAAPEDMGLAARILYGTVEQLGDEK